MRTTPRGCCLCRVARLVQLELRDDNPGLDVGRPDVLAIRVLAHDPRALCRCRREEAVRICLRQDGVATLIRPGLDLLRVGELGGVRDAVADRVAEEDELPLDVAPEVNVRRETRLVSHLEDVLHELALAEVLDRRHPDLGGALREQPFRLLTLDRVAAGLPLRAPSGHDSHQRNRDETESLHIIVLRVGCATAPACGRV